MALPPFLDQTRTGLQGVGRASHFSHLRLTISYSSSYVAELGLLIIFTRFGLGLTQKGGISSSGELGS
ncbi:hypothetical protein [Paenibacillus sp. Marseille-P2973]|uniref:hypothetical protein n=1 Tax=Paenibacillus sp. Marseille-P2973 TaxID=1871032 RepID=UPI001B398DDC|nr:hypothetical protein [Paenibacillus sp. Marseille-P2973]